MVYVGWDLLCYNGSIMRKNVNKIGNGGNQKEESKNNDLIRGIGKGALALGAAAAVATGVSRLNKDIVDTDRIKDAEVIRYDGYLDVEEANLRWDPDATVGEADSNIYTKIKDGVVFYRGKIYVINVPDDANGDWYGFESDKFTISLVDADCIDEVMAERINNREEKKDGYVWVNSKYVELRDDGVKGNDVNS